MSKRRAPAPERALKIFDDEMTDMDRGQFFGLLLAKHKLRVYSVTDAPAPAKRKKREPVNAAKEAGL